MKYSVVIPSYNSKNTVLNTLESVFREAEKVNYDIEVIVVDSSDDGTSLLIEENFKNVTLIKLKNQTFQGKARNIGSKAARGDYLVFIDSDCILGENYFLELEEVILKKGKEYDGFGGGIKNGTPQSVVGTSMFLLQFRDFLLDRECEVTNFPALNMVYKREKFLEMGGFPEYLGSSEETAFNLKFVEKYKIFFSPHFFVYHINKKVLKGFLFHQIKNGYNFREFKKKYKFGSFFSNVILFLPFFPFYRFFKSFGAILKNSSLTSFLPVSFLIFVGFCFYSVGELLSFLKIKAKKVNRL